MSDSDRFHAGDVFWAPDPFRDGADPRPWLVVASETLPYRGEEYICTALTTSDLPENLEIGERWISGRHPGTTSYCSPWVIATIKHEAVARPQGRVTDAFIETIRRRCIEFLTETE